MKDLFCNACGRQLVTDNDILKEDALFITKEWGYFSNKDGEVHELCICEECYDKMIKKLAIPVRRTDTVEYI